MSKQIAARFYIAKVAREAYGTGTTPYGSVTLRASTRGDKNKAWAAATPSGEFTMQVHSEAMTVFNDHIGQDVDILMTIVDPEVPTA